MIAHKFKVGERCQRIGWQVSATGTVKWILKEDATDQLLLVEWDFRGMENDITTCRASDLIPENWLPKTVQ